MPQPDTATPETSEQAILAQPRGPESVQLEGQLCVPQFGILHILILTAIAAALFKYKVALSPVSLPGNSFAACCRTMLWSLPTLLFAVILVGSGVLIRTKCSRMGARLQPGHWLLIIATFVHIPGAILGRVTGCGPGTVLRWASRCIGFSHSSARSLLSTRQYVCAIAGDGRCFWERWACIFSRWAHGPWRYCAI